MKPKVCVAMSGGVDSSLSALLLMEQGYDVCGLTMKQFDASAYGNGEFPDAAHDAAAVAEFLGIKHHVVDTQKEFSEKVVSCFVSEYARGKTPNPCILCNRSIKFGLLLEYAKKLGCEYLATGHYARIENGILYRGLDPAKDQSYFLYVLYACDIKHILFPLGSMRKQETREQALAAGLPSAKRKESQDICFIPDNDNAGFLSSRIAPHSGPIIDMQGTRVGTHTGVHNYTIGQRKGLGALGQRMFVKEIQPETNTVVVADNESLSSKRIAIRDFVSGPFELHAGDKFHAQIRYRSPAAEGCLSDINGSDIKIEFDTPVRAIAPGQAAVLYRKDMVIGGGTIFSGLSG